MRDGLRKGTLDAKLGEIGSTILEYFRLEVGSDSVVYMVVERVRYQYGASTKRSFIIS